MKGWRLLCILVVVFFTAVMELDGFLENINRLDTRPLFVECLNSKEQMEPPAEETAVFDLCMWAFQGTCWVQRLDRKDPSPK